MNKLFITIFLLMSISVSEMMGQVYTHPTCEKKSNPNTKILKITITDDYTIVEIEHKNTFGSGGWANISPETAIRIPKKSEKLKLIKAKGIPISPNRHYYKSQSEVLKFKLYFPPINPGTKTLDVIEYEGSGKAFNFYGIKLKPMA